MSSTVHQGPFRILAIHAHPDDLELQCAGTVALLKQKGHHVVMANMTPGDKGSAELGPEEIAAVRRQEAQDSAKLLGVECLCLEFRDLEIDINHDARRRVTEVLRKTQPDIILTAPPIDYMSDHEMTSRLVRDACFCAAVPNYVTGQWDPAPITKKIPALYYVDPVEGTDWFGNQVPYDFVVDITSTMDLKLQMLACHKSQREWLRRQHGMDEYLDSCRRHAEQRGKEAGYQYGEAFRQYKGHPYPHENLLLQALNTTV
jgi:LmbE family N-acetylglucosaminyl deacetylase